MGRGRKRLIVCGATETGKSTIIKELIAPRIGIDAMIVHDINQQEAWYHLPEISLDEFARMKTGMYRTTDMDYEKFFSIAFNNFRHGTIISEDATNYLGDKPNRSIMPNLIGLRHPKHDVDIIMVTHSLMDTPKYIIRHANELILKKTGDVWNDVKGRFEQKREEVFQAFTKLNDPKNPFPYDWERIVIHKTGTL